jgi:hypothetical protein
MLGFLDAADAEAYVQSHASKMDRNANHSHRPLKADELHVLRSQYEKEGEYVGIQTKFNYAWACLPGLYEHICNLLMRFRRG